MSSPVRRLSPSLTSVPIDGRVVTVRMGTGYPGKIPGGHPCSIHNLLAAAVIERAADDLAMPAKEVKRIYYAIGRVMQALLLNGQAVGIPHVGALNVVDRRVNVPVEKESLAALRERLIQGKVGAATIGKNPEALKRTVARMAGWRPPDMRRGIKFRTSMLLRRMFADNCLEAGRIKEQVQDALSIYEKMTGRRPKLYRKRLGRDSVFIDKTGQPVDGTIDHTREAP